MHQWIWACEDWHGFNFVFAFFYSYYNLNYKNTLAVMFSI